MKNARDFVFELHCPVAPHISEGINKDKMLRLDQLDYVRKIVKAANSKVTKSGQSILDCESTLLFMTVATSINLL